MEHTLDLPAFRAAYPAFSNTTNWPDPYVTEAWNMAVDYFGADDTCRASGDRKQRMLNLMTAHLLATWGPVQQATAGASPALGAKTSATVDKVTVQRVGPPVRSALSYWLGSTSWGVALWALLESSNAGGFFAVGRPETSMLRRAPARFR